ncbi:centrosomal protein of 57 kDa [Hyperolius riggenbachi]|uniref:centrosomal protein of 57 kDa n=1 Tax=Hyperolius riggenbachi TaxID=752182 RepID=UPI0035A357DC
MIPGREMAASGQQPSMLDSPFPQTLGGRSAKGTHSSTSYASYPKGMPFINSDYPRSPIRSGHAYPESNGKAIISALKNLQEKLHQLELDRLKAEENMKQLTKESSDCRLQLHEQRRSKESLLDDVSRRNKELSSQLSAAHSRCSVLEKQLDYMRKMVQNAESERNSVLEKQLAKLLKESRPHKEASAKDCKPLQGGKDRSPARARHGRRSPGEKSRRNLQLLRDMQTIQSTLRKDDVHWS